MMCLIIAALGILMIAQRSRGHMNMIIDKQLYQHEEALMNSLLREYQEIYRNESLGSTYIKHWIIPSWNTYELAKVESKINQQPSADSKHIIVLSYCHQCIDVMHVTNTSQSDFCSHICWNDFVLEWNSCQVYVNQVSALTDLINMASNRSENLIFYYDQERATAIQPVIDSISSHIKGIYMTQELTKNTKGYFPIPLQNEALQEVSTYIISVNVEEATQLLQKGQDYNVLGPEFHWLVDIRNNHSTAIEEHFSEYMQGGDNIALVTTASTMPNTPGVPRDLLVCHNDESTDGPQVNNGYNKKANLIEVKKCMGPCDSPAGLTTVAGIDPAGNIINGTVDIFPEQFTGFHGRVFNITTITYSPFIVLIEHENGTSKYSGLCIRLLETLAQELDFKYILHEVPDGKFGIEENGVWNGMIGEVYRQEADMAVSGITISAERESAVDFTFPYWEEPTAVLVKRTPQDTKIFWVFRPLHWQVWLLLVASIVIVTILITALTRVDFLVKPYQKRDPFIHAKHTLWFVFGSLFQQSGYQQPNTAAGQASTGSWWLVVVIVCAIYTGNLIAFLTITKIPLPFETLEEMTSQTEYQYGVEDGIIQMALFQNAEDGIYKDIWRGIKSDYDNIVDTGDQGVDKVTKEKYAFIGDKTYIASTANGRCDLVFIKEEFYKVGFAFAVKDGWPYKKYLDKAIMKLVEGGFIETWRREFWPTNECETGNQVVDSQAMNLEVLSGNFSLLFIGTFIATIIFILEFIHRRFRKVYQLDHLDFHVDIPRKKDCENPELYAMEHYDTQPNMYHSKFTDIHEQNPFNTNYQAKYDVQFESMLEKYATNEKLNNLQEIEFTIKHRIHLDSLRIKRPALEKKYAQKWKAQLSSKQDMNASDAKPSIQLYEKSKRKHSTQNNSNSSLPSIPNGQIPVLSGGEIRMKQNIEHMQNGRHRAQQLLGLL